MHYATRHLKRALSLAAQPTGQRRVEQPAALARRFSLGAFGSLASLGLAAAVGCMVLLSSAPARADIRSANDHPKYAVELDTHLVWQWADQWWWDDDGIGLGLRGSIPVIQNGPVPSINNNFAVTFGLDWAHFDYSCGNNAFNYSCSGNDIWLPIAVQWNFFLTNVISLYPELGLALQHSQLNADSRIPVNGCSVINGIRYCGGSNSHTRLDMVLWLGSRFMLSRTVALTLRLGTPSLLLGISFLL